MIAATQIRAIGNSSGFTLPTLILKQLGWQRGDVLLVRSTEKGKLTVEKQANVRQPKTEQTAAD